MRARSARRRLPRACSRGSRSRAASSCAPPAGRPARFLVAAQGREAKDPIDKDARLAVLWVGHATALVQIDDKVILTDPVFTSTVGMLSRRLVEPGIDPQDLPPLDAVLISHMHYDHLSLGSLELIEPRSNPLVPRGGLAYLRTSVPRPRAPPVEAWRRTACASRRCPSTTSAFATASTASG